MTFELLFCSYDLMLKDNWLMIVEPSDRPKISGNDNQNAYRVNKFLLSDAWSVNWVEDCCRFVAP